MEPIDILLVEDNPDDQELTLRAFKKQKLTNRIFVVNDGEEALDFLYCKGKFSERNDYDKPKCILLDLKLPKKDGIEVLKVIKADNKLKSIPVIVLTSSTEEGDMIQSYDLGVNSYIVKPVGFNEFIDCVGNLGFYWMILNNNPK